MRAYLDAVESTPLGSLALNRLWPAYFFALVVGAKLVALREALLEPTGRLLERGEWGFVAWLVHQSLTTLFLAVVVVLFIVRKPVVGARSSFGGAAVAVAGTFALALLSTTPAGPRPWELLVVASALIVAGLLLALAALLALSTCFGVFPEARGLVTHGPYRWVRHPMYLGELVSGLGLVLPALSPHNLAVYLLFCGLQYWRAVNEERALEAAFPEYRAYRHRTWRLIPWLH